MIRRANAALMLVTASLFFAADKPAVNWGDQGGGVYRNPILKADYSDPDVIQAGSDFYLVASDFHFMGIQVLHSRDLVNWKVIGQVFDHLPLGPKYDQMKAYAEGTWAPALRYHNGEFYLFVCTPYDGLFMWHTKDPAGKWSDVVTVKAVPGWEDPCPFWDDDGQAYLIHSKKGAGPLILNKMSADGTQLLDEGVTIYTGPTAEGPKMFKRHGYYYISHPEGGVGTGWQAMQRSKNIYGPYERKIVLSGGPHQGGMVELSNGEGWFIGFKSTGWLGRICYLEPVTWGADDWPVFGDSGKPVDAWKKPRTGHSDPIGRPEVSDDFKSATLNPIWQWNHNPVNESWSLTERRGFLRLKALPAESLSLARNTLTQKLWDDYGVIETRIEAGGMADGQRAGLAFESGPTFEWVAVEKTAGGLRVVWDKEAGPEVKGTGIWLRGEYRQDRATLLYSLDGKTWIDTEQHIVLKFASWKGARFGCFSYGPSGGYADIDYVHYRYQSTPLR